MKPEELNELRSRWGKIASDIRRLSTEINKLQEDFSNGQPHPIQSPHSRFSKTWKELKKEDGQSQLPLLVVIALWVLVCALVFFAL